MNRIALFQSASTKLAIFFSTLLITALVLLTFEIYTLSNGGNLRPLFTDFILALVLFICLGLFFVSFKVTKRIAAITSTADRIISTRDLTQRIPIANSWGDLSKLAQTLNRMLAEIEQSVVSIRQVSDNIAHDLRTPLTRLRTHIELLRSEPPSDTEAQQENFNQLIAECDGLLTTFNALLRIANIESGRHHSVFERINLAPVVEDVIELYEPIASEKALRLAFRVEPCFIMGDKDLLFQMLANLLDNAIKHTPPEGTVVLTLKSEESHAILTLSDSGPGIPDLHKPHVFRRFYRVESCRSLPGSGLGLSLVRAIVDLHRGTIILTDYAPSGLIVTVTI